MYYTCETYQTVYVHAHVYACVPLEAKEIYILSWTLCGHFGYFWKGLSDSSLFYLFIQKHLDLQDLDR